MRDSFLQALTELAEEDSNIMLLTADLGYGVFENFEKKFCPRQYLNVGVAEQNLTGLAAGLALEGKRVFTYSIGNFPTLRCLEQVRNDLAYHELNVTIVGSGGGFSYGALGMSHHSTEDLSVMRSLPAIEVIAPCSKWEMYHATREIVSRKGVGYLRIDKTCVEDEGDNNFEIGKTRTIRNGTDVVVFAIGGIISEVLIAADKLMEKEIDVRVISVHTLKPLDKESILAHVLDVQRVVTVEENNVIGGLSSAISEVCVSNCVKLKSFKSIGLNDMYSSVVGSQHYLRQHYNMDSDAIFRAISESVDNGV